MKPKLLFMSIISIILFFSSDIFAQSVSKIYLKNGNMIKGEIIETILGKIIKVKLKDGSVINYQFKEIDKIDTVPICKQGSVGFGFGIPYGGFPGINFEYATLKIISISLGIGKASDAEIGYNLDLKFYLREIRKSWRPRFSLHFGYNSEIRLNSNEYIKESIKEWHKGFSLGLGQRWMWGDKKQHGLDLDLQFLLTSSAYDRVKEIEDMYWDGIIEDVSPFAFSIGYRYGF